MPTALVTGSPDQVPDITVALKSAGFDILAAGVQSPDDAPDLAEGSVDCYVQLPADGPPPTGGALRRTRDLLAGDMVGRFDTAIRFLPLLAPGAVVVLVADGPDVTTETDRPAHPDVTARRRLVEVLAEAILQEQGQIGVRAAVIGGDRAAEEIATLAATTAPEPRPWWHYADVDPELGFADWRDSVLCLASSG